MLLDVGIGRLVGAGDPARHDPAVAFLAGVLPGARAAPGDPIPGRLCIDHVAALGTAAPNLHSHGSDLRKSADAGIGM